MARAARNKQDHLKVDPLKFNLRKSCDAQFVPHARAPHDLHYVNARSNWIFICMMIILIPHTFCLLHQLSRRPLRRKRFTSRQIVQTLSFHLIYLNVRCAAFLLYTAPRVRKTRPRCCSYFAPKWPWLWLLRWNINFVFRAWCCWLIKSHCEARAP